MPVRRVDNPPNPWLSAHVEWLDEPPAAELVVYEEECKSALSENDSPDLHFRFSINPYRGCAHACSYCYARPSHQFLGFGAGTDFDRRIVVKTNVAEALSLDLAKPSWKRDLIVFSGNTDCYQPLEASYGLTRRCLEVCCARRTPIGMITKSALVRRDIDVLARLAREVGAHVTLTIPFLDETIARALEPGAPSPSKRFEVLAALSAAGIRTGLAIAPLIPGLNDSDIPLLLARAREAGATSAFMTLLRLPAEVEPVFRARLADALPERVKKIESALRDVRGGELYRGGFGTRMRGEGARWEAVQRLFDIHRRRLGFVDRDDGPPQPTDPRARSMTAIQNPLFD